MNDDQRQEWVMVAQFMAFDMGIMADMAVSKLQGSGIPARRFPTGVIAGAIGTAGTTCEPIRVVVPPEHEDRAREILAERFDDDVLVDQ